MRAPPTRPWPLAPSRRTTRPMARSWWRTASGAAPAPTRAHLARYHCVVRNDVAAARAVLDEALEAEPEHAGLWQARARVEAHRVADDKAAAVFARVAEVYDRALGPEST